MADLFKAGGQIHIDASAIPKEIIAAANNAQKIANENPIKISITTDTKVMEKQLKKDQKTLFKELTASYEKYSNFELDDKGYAKAVQMYVASGGELNDAFKRLAISYNDLKEELKSDFIPIKQIELFKDSIKKIEAISDNASIDSMISDAFIQKITKAKEEIIKLYEAWQLAEIDLSDEQFVKYVEDFEKMGGRFTDDMKEIEKTYRELQDFFTNTGLPKLLNEISSYAITNDNKHVSGFWDELETKINNGDEALKELLSDLGLYDEKLKKLNLINTGANNSGGIIGEDSVLISRKDTSPEEFDKKNILKQKLDEAAESGINVARILDLVYDKESKMMIELQTKAQGSILGSYGDSVENDIINLDFLEATDEQVKKLISDLIKLQELGINTDLNLENILYDKKKGFSIIDLGLNTKDTSKLSPVEIVEDLLGGTVDEALWHFEETGNSVNDTALNALKDKFKKHGEALSQAIADGYAEGQDSHSPSKESEKLNDDFVAGIEESANKNAEKLTDIGKQMADNIKDGFKEGMSKSDTITLLPDNQSSVLSESQMPLSSPTIYEDSDGQLSFVEQTKKTVDLIEEESGQMSMFENVAEKATDSAIEGQMTLNDILNKNIEGQITLNDLIAKQDKAKDKKVKEKVPDGWIKNVDKAWDAAIKEDNDLTGKTLLNDYNGIYNSLLSKDDKTDGYKKQLEEFKRVIDEINATVPIKISDEKERKKLEELDIEAKELVADLSDIKKTGKYDLASKTDIDALSGKIFDTLHKNTAAPKEIRMQLEGLIIKLKELGLSKADIEKIRASFVSLNSQMKATGKTGDSLGTKIQKKFKDVAAYFATYVSIQDAIQVIRQGFETIKEYDTALTEMNKVSEESISVLKEFQKESFGLADSIGTTAKQIQSSTADFIRLGESLEEAKRSAQDANILFNVSEFGSIDEATESLVSMSQAYKELEKGEIIDVVNNLGLFKPKHTVMYGDMLYISW